MCFPPADAHQDVVVHSAIIFSFYQPLNSSVGGCFISRNGKEVKGKSIDSLRIMRIFIVGHR